MDGGTVGMRSNPKTRSPNINRRLGELYYCSPLKKELARPVIM
jgi:hypothetical protein